MAYKSIKSPYGDLTLFEENDQIVALEWGRTPGAQSTARFLEAKKQLDAYFAGTLQEFDLDLDLRGTEFQLRVWNQLLTIPFGHTVTYQEIASLINSPKSFRAIGHANGLNPVSIIVPCHRVIGSDGSLTGYAGGLWRKQWLLEHELKTKQLSLF